LVVFSFLLAAALISALYFRDDIHNLPAYNQGDQPTHDAAADSYQKSAGKIANPGTGSSDENQSILPKDIDGAVLVIKGIRQTINLNFRKLYCRPVI